MSTAVPPIAEGSDASKDMGRLLEEAAVSVRGETWADADAQARYLRALENAAWSLYCVLAGTPSDRKQCVREWASILRPEGEQAGAGP